jgi:rare lipoprotein A
LTREFTCIALATTQNDSIAALLRSHCDGNARLGLFGRSPATFLSHSNKTARRRTLKSNLLAVTFATATMAFVSATATSAHAQQNGIASMYTTAIGTKTASGRRLHDGAMTAAHRTLPFGTKVRVTNKRNGRSVVVTITDRGPFIRGRVIDLTLAAANAIGMGRSIAPVSVQVL